MTDLAALKNSKDALSRVIRDTKAKLRALNPDYGAAFRAMEDDIRREVDALAGKRERGESIVPEIAYADIAAGRVSGSAIAAVRRTGTAVIRGVFPRAQAEDWNEQLGEYISANGYYERKVDPNLDKYFSTLKSDRPQIFGIYWSKPQIQARQSESLAAARAFLNGLWRHDSEGRNWFDPTREASYADRTRRRQPGDVSLGLSPHMDAGSVERWIDEGYQRVYRHVFSGDISSYDPFDGAWRTQTSEIPSPAVCSVFRTYQGWTALTPQGPGDGTLQLIPIARGIAYMLLRALQDDVPDDELCGAQPARALSALPDWHPALMPALSPIPLVQPGDTVWWHPDIVHAVEDRHGGSGYSNVIYIGAAPWCEKNAAYLPRQAAAFLKGESAPDFAAENYEVAYKGRATAADLTDLGKKQMGLTGW
ncbi:MAG: DUF1479 domain-containing protein [Dongiaceae bacterium]